MQDPCLEIRREIDVESLCHGEKLDLILRELTSIDHSLFDDLVVVNIAVSSTRCFISPFYSGLVFAVSM